MTVSLATLALKQLDFVVNGNSWHAALKDLLDDITSAEAAWRPENGGHTIYEIVNHLAYSAEVVASRLQGNPGKWEESEGWIETPAQLDSDAWDRSRTRLLDARQQFSNAITSLDDEKLSADRGDKPPFIDIVLQVIHHEAFHTGQIALLRRQQGKQALL